MMPKLKRMALSPEDLALPAGAVAQLRNVAAERVSTVILTVPSGTSRKQAAESLARTMGRRLMSVDPAQVVSRFAGETEKNLNRLFETAAAGDAVLFIDEADALFGKRSEVKDSHDRYANIAVSSLLQKLEAYDGIVVLASGGRQNMDPAFLRRLRHVVNIAWPPTGN